MPQADKAALVTGGAKRIGRAIVRDLAANGFAVAIHCNASRKEAGALADDIRAGGGRAEVMQADLRDAGAAGDLVAHGMSALGRLDLVVNNASLFEDDAATDFDEQVWDAHFDLHVKAPAAIARAYAALLPTDGEGLIVNMVDQRVWNLTPRFFSYTLSKSALWTATRTMAQALGPRIRVNAIAPGPTLANARQDTRDFERQIDALILKRGPELGEFGATIRYLWQARSVTGQMIALDGGQHLAWETPDVAGVSE